MRQMKTRETEPKNVVISWEPKKSYFADDRPETKGMAHKGCCVKEGGCGRKHGCGQHH